MTYKSCESIFRAIRIHAHYIILTALCQPFLKKYFGKKPFIFPNYSNSLGILVLFPRMVFETFLGFFFKAWRISCPLSPDYSIIAENIPIFQGAIFKYIPFFPDKGFC